MHFDVLLAQSMFLRNRGDDKSVRLYLQHLGMGMPTRHANQDGYMQCTFFFFSFLLNHGSNIVHGKCRFISVNAVCVCAACVKTIPENQRPAGGGGGGGEGGEKEMEMREKNPERAECYCIQKFTCPRDNRGLLCEVKAAFLSLGFSFACLQLCTCRSVPEGHHPEWHSPVQLGGELPACQVHADIGR